MYEERPGPGILEEDRGKRREARAPDDDGGTTVGASPESGESPGSEATVGQAQPRVLTALSPSRVDIRLYCLLFFTSGFPALLYQIVWQRALFTIYGVNIESVTIVVTVFMLGLGLGSLAGGWLSTNSGLRLLLAFGLIELGIGAYGALSMSIFHWAASYTAGASMPATMLLTFLLLLIPTLLMGSTLPLLVAHLVRRTANVGESVGTLYAANTLGSAAACLCAALFVMRGLGESGSIRLAALINLLVGVTALVLNSHSRAFSPSETPCSRTESAVSRRAGRPPFPILMLFAGVVGFISLAYEIVWYRLYSFVSGGAAPSFAKLLACYLFGIGYGSFVVRDFCRKKLAGNRSETLRLAATVVIWASIVGFLVGPALAFGTKYIGDGAVFPFVLVAAALLGAAFPLLSHAAINAQDKAGRLVSYLYLSNIAGCALGSLLVGFVIMDHWSMPAIASMLLGMGLAVAVFFALIARPIYFGRALTVGIAVSAGLFLLVRPLFSNIYERLLYKASYSEGATFRSLVENRSGVIAVAQDGTVFGGGAYDGRFNTDIVHDTNGIFRAYAIAGLHAQPKDVLIIGLSSGSWAQVIANHPRVEAITIVEINPGYLPLIREWPAVATLLQNPKVEVVIDDGRRWLVRNANRKFDFILMNTTFHWRANTSNLLSVEFLRLLRGHLKPHGIAYYNTTASEEALATGAAEFPYALRISNFLAVSDSPITLDRILWKTMLVGYKINGRPVFDLRNTIDQARLTEVLSLPEMSNPKREIELVSSMEQRPSLLARLKGVRLISDDNMGAEWK